MKLSIVIPCYNEQEVLTETTKRVTELLDRLKASGKVSDAMICYVDDGSKDNTWSMIEKYHRQNTYVHGIKLSKNSGHQNAVWAGLEYVAEQCDAAVSIDADLQDDVAVIEDMVDKYNNESCEVVFGARQDRKTDTIFKRTSALLFYKLMLAMGVDMVYNHADFRLMSKRAIMALMQYPERNIFLRGMVPMIGFKHDVVYYNRAERFAGQSKYPLRKMMNFAIDGITSFSIRPLRLITSIGFLMMVIAIGFGCWALTMHLTGHTIQGWTSMLLSIWFIGGVQLLCIGVLGEYIGKIYTEVKRRPRYFIEKNI